MPRYLTDYAVVIYESDGQTHFDVAKDLDGVWVYVASFESRDSAAAHIKSLPDASLIITTLEGHN